MVQSVIFTMLSCYHHIDAFASSVPPTNLGVHLAYLKSAKGKAAEVRDARVEYRKKFRHMLDEDIGYFEDVCEDD